MEENICKYYIYKELISRVHKELLHVNSKKPSNPSKKWAKDLNRCFSKDDIQVTNKHMTCKIKPTKYHFTPMRITVILKKQRKTSVGKEKLELLCTAGGHVKWCSCCGKEYCCCQHSLKKAQNYHMIQQFCFWVYAPQNVNQGLEQMFEDQCS